MPSVCTMRRASISERISATRRPSLVVSVHTATPAGGHGRKWLAQPERQRGRRVLSASLPSWRDLPASDSSSSGRPILEGLVIWWVLGGAQRHLHHCDVLRTSAEPAQSFALQGFQRGSQRRRA